MDCQIETALRIAVFVLSIVVKILCVVALSVSWTDYAVTSSLPVTAVLGGSAELKALYYQWPQMFYPRSVLLRQVCYPDVNNFMLVWLDVFHRDPKICGNRRRGGGAICYCMPVNDYLLPINYNTSSDQISNIQRTLLAHYNACYGLLTVIIVLAALVLISQFFIRTYPGVIGIAAFICLVLEETAIIAVVIVFCSAENMESTILQPPHLGFIDANQNIGRATTASRSHGFALACALVALININAVCYVVSWIMRLRDESAGKCGDDDPIVRCCSERCCCCSWPATDANDTDDTVFGALGPAPPQYGAVGAEDGFDTASTKKLAP